MLGPQTNNQIDSLWRREKNRGVVAAGGGVVGAVEGVELVGAPGDRI